MKKTVLIIDSEISSRTLTGIMLEAGGRFQTLKAHDGESAIQLMGKGLPDLIVIDIDTPAYDGIKLCRAFRDNHSTGTIPILIISSRGDADSVMRGLDAGANDYLAKPILHRHLVAKAQTLLSAHSANP